MKYRARITKVQSWVENNYNLNMFSLVHDAKDIYIEVDNEDEAELLESINKAATNLLELKLKWYEKYDKDCDE